MTYHVTYTRESGTQIPMEFESLDNATRFASVVHETMTCIEPRVLDLPDAIVRYCVQNENGMIISEYRRIVNVEE